MSKRPVHRLKAPRIRSSTGASPRFPENHHSPRVGSRGAPPSASVIPAAAAIAAAAPTPGEVLLNTWGATLASADQAYLTRQFSVASDGYSDSLVQYDTEYDNYWNTLTPDEQATGWQYFNRGYFGVADSLHSLGDWEGAEEYYMSIASGDSEDPASALSADQFAYLFLRWATLYLDWGNTLFAGGDAAGAPSQYTKVLNPDGSVPPPDAYIVDSNPGLYGYPAMQSSMDAVATIANNLAALVDQQQTAASLDVNPVLAATILEIYQQLTKISNGLDYWGHWSNSIPIWTFDYLQGAATNFAQFAINAERDFIHFQERSDEGSATRQQLVQMASQSNAEVAAATAQARAAAAEAVAYATGAALANTRATDALANATEYSKDSALSIQMQAEQVAISGGDALDVDGINGYAQNIITNDYYSQVNNLSQSTRSAGAALAAGRATRSYEIDSMERSATELGLAATQAQQEAAAAQARVAAANAATAVASLHAEAAQQNLATFDSQTFTPDVWQSMADTMWRLYRRYLDMALNTALLMQRAYNFETDQSLSFIKQDYSTDEVKGLLGADALMADIQSFTYDLITSTIGKAQPVRQTISLAQRYAYLFETQLRPTGVMEFETRVDDFDMVCPGSYAGRLEGDRGERHRSRATQWLVGLTYQQRDLRIPYASQRDGAGIEWAEVSNPTQRDTDPVRLFRPYGCRTLHAGPEGRSNIPGRGASVQLAARTATPDQRYRLWRAARCATDILLYRALRSGPARPRARPIGLPARHKCPPARHSPALDLPVCVLRVPGQRGAVVQPVRQRFSVQ